MRTSRKVGCVVGLALLGAVAGLFLYDLPYAGLVAPTERALVLAHRGFGNLAPDNSLAGARMAMRERLDGVDVDGQLTRDGEIVVFHDVSLERFTGRVLAARVTPTAVLAKLVVSIGRGLVNRL